MQKNWVLALKGLKCGRKRNNVCYSRRILEPWLHEMNRSETIGVDLHDACWGDWVKRAFHGFPDVGGMR
jgi:hypothetical protein